MTKNELEKCIEDYGKHIYSFCLKLTADRQEADELYQDTFLTAMEQIEKIDYGQNPKSYLLSITIRIWKNKRRKYAWRKRIMEEQYMPGIYEIGKDNMAWEPLENNEEIHMVREAVSKLPEKMKLVILLYYMEELSVDEIAGILHIPKGTVKSRLFHAREKLKSEMEVF